MTEGQLQQAVRSALVRHAMSKVPEVTVYFWIIKVLTTGMGEVASDYLAQNLRPLIAVGLGGAPTPH